MIRFTFLEPDRKDSTAPLRRNVRICKIPTILRGNPAPTSSGTIRPSGSTSPPLISIPTPGNFLLYLHLSPLYPPFLIFPFSLKRLPKTTSPKGRLQFTRAWMKSHIEDAERLSMPVIFGEFGFSSKEDEDQFDQPFRNAFIELVYETILNSTRRGGAGGGSLLWQLFPEGVDYMDDGYAVVLGDLPHTASLLSRHSRRLQIFNSRCSWNCRWSCRKREEDDDGESSILLESNSR